MKAVCNEAQDKVKGEVRETMEREMRSLREWAGEEWKGESLHEMEVEVRERALRLARAALEHRLRSRQGYEGTQRACECGGVQRFHSHRDRCMETLVGTVHWERAYYWCGECGESSVPMDRRLRVERGQFSEGMCKVAAHAGAHLPFKAAARTIYESSGQQLRISPSTVLRTSERIGGELTVQWEAERLRAEGGHWEASKPAPVRAILEADGTMIPTQEGWKEAKVSTVMSLNAEGEPTRKVVFARVDNPERFGNRLWLETKKQRVDEAKDVAVLGDGASWIWNQFEIVCSRAVQILDFFHAKTHLYELAHAHYGANSPKANSWVYKRETELLSDYSPCALQAISRLRPANEEARQKREENLRYFENNQHRMNYQAYQNAGWPIGSGCVEGAARTFVGKRMKVGGAKWIKHNAQFILDLRTKIESGDWDTFWAQRFSPN